MNTQTFRIGGKDYTARYSIRMYMLYESMTGRVATVGTITDEVVLMLSALLVGTPSERLTLDELTDAVDATPEILAQWRKFFAEQVALQEQRMAGVATEDTSDSDDSKKKE